MGYLDAIPVYCSGVRFEVESRGDVLGSLRARALWSCRGRSDCLCTADITMVSSDNAAEIDVMMSSMWQLLQYTLLKLQIGIRLTLLQNVS